MQSLSNGSRSPKRLRNVVAAASAAAVLVFIAACSSTSTPTSSSATAGQEMSSELKAFLTEASKPYKGQTVNVLAVSSVQSKVISDLKGEFTDATGINVKITSLAESDAIAKTQVTFSAQSPGFDVMQALSFFVPQYASNNWLVPVDELKKNSKVTYPGLSTDAYATSSVAQMSYASKLWAMPMFAATQVMYYRADVFQKYGVQVPKTMDELLNVIAKIDSPEVRGIALRTASGSTQNLFPFSSWLYNQGGSYYGKLDANTGKYSEPALDSPEAIKAAQMYAKVVQDHAPTGSLNWTFADVTRAFLAGQVAIMQEGSPFGGTLNDPAQSTVAGKVGAFAIPAGPAGSYFPSAAQGWAVSKYSARPEASWLFAQWATDPSVLLEASLKEQFPAPPLTSVFTNPDFIKKYDFPGFLDALKTSLDGKSSPIGGPYIPAVPNWAATGQPVSVDFNKIINGQSSAAAAFADANKALADGTK